jgi:hypothetical protein
MSKKDITKILLNEKHVKDMVSESIMLREFSLYGCDDQPGKVIGRNPFSEKCVDITGYDGPDAPPNQISGGGGKGGPIDRKKTIGSVVDSPEDFAKFIWDIYTSGVDYKEMADCIWNDPWFSGFGMLFGGPAVRIIPRLVHMSAKTGYSAVSSSGKVKAMIDSYAASRVAAETNEAYRLWIKIKTMKAGAKWAAIATAAGLGVLSIGALKAAQKSKMTPEFMSGPINDFVSFVDKNVSGEESLRNWKCFFASAVAGLALGVIGTQGIKGIAKVAKMTKAGTIDFAGDLLKSSLARRHFAKALKGAKSEQLTVFKALQEMGKLPAGAKIALERGASGNALKVSGLGDGVMRFPVNELPASMKKLAVNDEVVLDISKLSDELKDVSTKMNDAVSDLVGSNARLVRESDFYKQLKSFKKLYEKYGNMPAYQIRSRALTNASEIMKDLSLGLEESLVALQKAQKNIFKGERNVKDLFRSTKSLRGSKSFDEIERLVLNKNTKVDDIPDIIERAFPGIGNQPETFTLFGKKVNLKEGVVEYFQEVKKFDQTQKQMISDIEFAKKALVDETGLAKSLFPDGAASNTLSSWFQSGAGSQHKQFWENLPATERKLSKLAGGMAMPALKNLIDNFFRDAALPAVAFIFGVNAMSLMKGKRITDEGQLNQIIRLLEAQVLKTDISKYEDANGNINIRPFLTDLLKDGLPDRDLFMSDTQSALEALEETIKTNDDYIKEVSGLINSGGTIPTKTEINLKVKEIIMGSLNPQGSKQQPNKPTQQTSDLMSQIPEGDLKQQSPFSVSIGGNNIQVSFTDKHIVLGDKKFQLSKFGAKPTIESVTKQGNKVTAVFDATITKETWTFNETNLNNLFTSLSNMSNGQKASIKIGKNSGDITRIQENKEVNKMSKKDIRQLVAEVLNENYSKYPYNANEPSEGEPDEDYMVEWSALVDEVCGSKVKNVDGDPKTMEDAAVEVAKLFVKDQDLFRDVLEMAGSNKSIGVEILQQLKAAREKNV